MAALVPARWLLQPSEGISPATRSHFRTSRLVQGCRHLEIDCWDGPNGPTVTHGHTFCTVENFSEVAKAIGTCAFVTSDLPVILSLEMHCSQEQQRSIAQNLYQCLGDKLLSVRRASPHLPWNQGVEASLGR